MAKHHHQELTVFISPWLDSIAVEQWDHITGGRPGRGYDFHCSIEHPNSFQVFEPSFYTRLGSDPISVDQISPHPGNGSWYRVRLQIFPDGTCGIAHNGIAIARSPVAFRLDLPYRIVLEAKSVDTEMLVGPVEVWTGIKPGVDWDRIEH